MLKLSSRQRLQNSVKAKALPRPAEMMVLCDALGVTLEQIMDGEPVSHGKVEKAKERSLESRGPVAAGRGPRPSTPTTSATLP